MPRKLFAAISQIVLGALIAIAPQTFAHVCRQRHAHGMPLHRSGRSGTGRRHRIAGNNRIFRAKPGQGRIGYRQCRAGRACRSGADHAGRRMQRLHDALPYGGDADAYRIGRAAGGARSSRRISRSQAGKAWLTCRISPLAKLPLANLRRKPFRTSALVIVVVMLTVAFYGRRAAFHEPEQRVEQHAERWRRSDGHAAEHEKPG